MFCILNKKLVNLSQNEFILVEIKNFVEDKYNNYDAVNNSKPLFKSELRPTQSGKTKKW